MTDHFHEPSKGHGLAHNPFKAIVAPRPIGWISTAGAAGRFNLAPYSFFNAVCDVPPLLYFSTSGHWKDTLNNVEATGEFVGVHIDRAFLKDGIFDTAAARPIARCGYRGDYTEVNSVFEMIRPA